MGKEVKTNAMRMLERAKVPYTAHEYPHEEGVAVDGIHVAQSMGRTGLGVQDPGHQGVQRRLLCVCDPGSEELDLKAACPQCGRKSVAMLHVADLLQGHRLCTGRLQWWG